MAKNFIYLDCPDQEIIAKKSLEYLATTNWLTTTGTWRGPIRGRYLKKLLEAVPELDNWLTDLNLKPAHFWILGFFDSSQIHIDSGSSYPRMNFPLSNNIGTAVTEFFEIKKIEKIPAKENGVDYWELKFDNNDATLLDHYELTKPIIFNPEIPHRVRFNKPLSAENPRLMFSIAFWNPPYHMLGLK
jgi:hypothetical protein